MLDINELTIPEVQKMYHGGKLSIKELVQEYLNRISEYDQKEPNKLNSILEINPDAISIAESMDRSRSKDTGQLYGIPVLLKDNIATADRMHSSAGSLALADSHTPFDADITASLREKGAIILGKTNMTELSNFMSDGMKAGYSSRGGTVISPYNKSADPSGSSTGSAVSVTANFCTAAFGTDTAGSVMSPAIKNGIVGFCPLAGTFSQKGIIPISFTLDTIGSMTRTVMDSIIILSELKHVSVPLEEVDMGRIVIGINQTNFNDLTVEEQAMTESFLKLMEKAGARLKPLGLPKVPQETLKQIQLLEFKYSINRYLADLPDDYSIRTLKDMIDFNNLDPDRALRYGQSLLLDAEQKTRGDMSEPVYRDLLQDRGNVHQAVFKSMQEIDICILTQNDLVMQFTGFPIVTVPYGLYQNGMPFGICLTSSTNEKLLTIANKIEQIAGNRVPPKLNSNQS